jgi:ankyrin repeat protein
MSRKRSAKHVTNLVAHRTLDLARLHDGAKTCDLGLRERFLAGGGQPDALVGIVTHDYSSWQAPLLICAITLGHLSSIELLLHAGANINAFCLNSEGVEMSPLMIACQSSLATAATTILLEHGADVCLRTPTTGMTALHIAALMGTLDTCRLLLAANGRALELCSFDGRSPLSSAVGRAQLPVVAMLHEEYGAHLGTTDINGNTLLHAAVARQPYLPLLAYLLRCGVDINAVNHIRATALLRAAGSGYGLAVQMFLEHGADPTIESNDGFNVLCAACGSGHADVVDVLLKSGMQTTAASRATRITPLMHAAMQGHAAVLRVLLAHGADVNAVDAEQRTALHWAAYRDRTDVIALLLEHDPTATNAADVNGMTPLLAAAGRSSAKCVQLLLDAGAAYRAVCRNGLTVLHGAAINKAYPEVLQLLLEHSETADIIDRVSSNCNCCGKQTPLMVCKQPALVKLLLHAGADAHKTTDTGNTCLHVAAAHARLAAVVCLLIKAGVDLHAVNSEGKTAAEVASYCGNALTAALVNRAAAGP